MSEVPSATFANTRVSAAASSALFIVGLLLLLPLTFVAFFVFVISLVPLSWTGIAVHAVPLAFLLGFGSALLAVVCGLLAIGLGIAGWKHVCGKVGMIGGIVVLGLPSLIWLFRFRF